jgi:hypothetical protein
MNRCAILLEGGADIPVVREIFHRHLGLLEKIDFSLHAHRGKGKLPKDLLGQAPTNRHGLLDLLPATLRGMSHYPLVVVLIDLDNESAQTQTSQLEGMLSRLTKRPKTVLFRFAIEETESWFIADLTAVKNAFPSSNIKHLEKITPDAIVGAWEQLADALHVKRTEVSGQTKFIWATKIAPHMNFKNPTSPSLNVLIGDLNGLQAA